QQGLASDPRAAVERVPLLLQVEEPALPPRRVQDALLLLLEEVAVAAAKIALVGDVHGDEGPAREADAREEGLRRQVELEERALLEGAAEGGLFGCGGHRGSRGAGRRGGSGPTSACAEPGALRESDRADPDELPFRRAGDPGRWRPQGAAAPYGGA